MAKTSILSVLVDLCASRERSSDPEIRADARRYRELLEPPAAKRKGKSRRSTAIVQCSAEFQASKELYELLADLPEAGLPCRTEDGWAFTLLIK